MAVSKVVYGTTVLVDLTADTVKAGNLLSGFTAHNAAGEQVVGAYTPGAETKHFKAGTVTQSSNSRKITIHKPDFTPAHMMLFVAGSPNSTSGAIRMAFSDNMTATTCEVLTAASLAIGIASTISTSETNGTVTVGSSSVSIDSGSNTRTFVKGTWHYIFWRDDTVD